MLNEVKIQVKFPGVYILIFEGGKENLATKNLALEKSVYGEKLIKVKGVEYRVWDPYRSKLAAAILKGLSIMPIKPSVTLLYLGAGSGTTVSHVSDIIDKGGKAYCVEFAARAMRELVNNVCVYRRNLIPIFADARFPNKYPISIPKVDVIYCDVAQPDQTKILLDNAEYYLKKDGFIMIALKARSINVTKDPSEIFKKEIESLKVKGFKIIQSIRLEPYEKDHAFIVAKAI
ncbi:fibrillarin-like rRNA/tRNA 2'-O-methyltransferase [Candidatus Bathyarchaeota archaeon]|nr:fibrillarin-like rRNA/tRNA 2'-O-methyltransferase [Candidatus Bathyarchaeota archaeon]